MSLSSLESPIRSLGLVPVCARRHVLSVKTRDTTGVNHPTPEVLARIERGDPSWETMVPPAVADIIKSKGLFRRQSGDGAARSDARVTLGS